MRTLNMVIGIVACLLIAPTALGVTEEVASIDITKFVNGEDANEAPGPVVNVGDAVEFRFLVNNTGTVNLTDVVITDSVLGEIWVLGPLNVNSFFDIYIYMDAEEGQHINVGTVTGMAPDGSQLVDTDPGNYHGVGDQPTPRVPAMPLAAIPVALGAVLLARRRRA